MKNRLIYFVHGTTYDNASKKCSGWKQVELNDLGREQAINLGKINSNISFDVIFTSDLIRAIDSAELAFPDAKKIQDKRLRECNYGDLDGGDKKLIVYEEHIQKKFPNGESLKDVEERVQDFINDISKEYSGKIIGIVAHRAPQLALDHKVRHRNDGAAAVLAVGGDAKIRGHLTDDIARHRGCKDGGIVRPGVVGVVQHDVDKNFRVVGGQHCHEGRHLFIVAVGAAVHIQLLGGAGLAADAVAGHIGVFAAAGAVAHLVLHHLPDDLAGTLADDLTAHICADLLNDIAVGIGDLIHHMGGDQIPAVDGGRNGGAHLQRGDGHGLTEGGGSQLHLAQLVGAVVLHKVGLAGQVHAGAGGKAEGIEVVIELLRADALPQLDVVDVAALAQRLGHIEQAVRLASGAVVGLLGNTVSAGASKSGVHGGHAGPS